MHVSYIVAAVVFLPNKYACVSSKHIWQVTVVNLICTVHIIIVSSFTLALALNFNDCTMEFSKRQ